MLLIKKAIVFCCLLLFFTNSYSQENYKVVFDNRHYLLDDMSEAVALYKFSGKSVKFDSEIYDIQFPENFSMTDTAFAFIFFKGWKNAPIANHTLILIGNYRQSPAIIIDANNNLDFSDDEVKHLSGLSETIRFKLFNSAHADAFCVVEMESINYKDEEHRNRLEKFILSNTFFNANEAVSSEFWLSVKRINYITTRSVLGNDSVYLGLVDGTGNGLFNDIQWDRIIVGDPESNSISAEFSEGGYLLEKDLKIQINGKTYVVKEVEPSGQFMVLETSDRVLTHLDEGSVIPDFSFQTMDGKKKNLYESFSDHPYILLDFWGTWCKPCVANIPKLKELSSKFIWLSIVGFNAHDDKDAAKEFVEKHNLKWLNGFATEEILKAFHVDKFPYYVLIQEDGSILKLNADLNDLEYLLGNTK